MSVYSLFMMLGGMLLPFLYGVLFLNERVGVFRWLALALLIAALRRSLPGTRPGTSAPGIRRAVYGSVCLNGAVSVISKAHQVSPQASSTYDFLIMTYLFQFGFGSIACAIAAICRRGKKELPPGEEKTEKEGGGKAALVLLAVVVAYALDSSVGYMLQLSGAKTLPAVLLYPLITGGTVVVSALFGRLVFQGKNNQIRLDRAGGHRDRNLSVFDPERTGNRSLFNCSAISALAFILFRSSKKVENFSVFPGDKPSKAK